jgi:hypothetical protein
MATPLGTNTVSSLARRYILPKVVDNVYGKNLMFFRLNTANKKIVRGGTQIEVPLMTSTFSAGGFFSGAEELTITTADTVKNAAWDWKQAYVPVAIDGLTLMKVDSPESIADVLRMQLHQAEMEMSRILGAALWNSSPAANAIDSIPTAVDDGSNTATYGGLVRSNNTFWRSQYDSTTTTLSLNALNSMFMNCTKGGHSPTVIVTTKANYQRYWALGAGAAGGQQYPVGPGQVDEQLFQAGFTNLIFNGVPIVWDDNVPAGHMYFLNEDFWWLAVHPSADFHMEDFQTPINQHAYATKLYWGGNLILNHCATQGKFTALAA